MRVTVSAFHLCSTSTRPQPPGTLSAANPKVLSLSVVAPPLHSLRIGAQQGHVYTSRSIGSPKR